MIALAALLVGLAAGQVDAWGEPLDEDAEVERRPRLSMAAWGGNAWQTGRADGGSAGLLGGEVAWAFRSLDVGLAAYGYRIPDQRREWTPVGLVRLVNRFQTGRGVEATFGFGLGAARADHWVAWFQVALGVRFDLGPLFVAGELAFEQYDLLHLAGGLGVRF